MRGQAPFFYFKMVISVLGVRTGERSREKERKSEEENPLEREKEGESVGEGEFKEKTRQESRLIYFICKKRKNLKRKKGLMIVRKKV